MIWKDDQVVSVEALFTDSLTFETERLFLRRLRVADAEDYFQFASNPIVTARTTWDRHHCIEDSVSYLEKVENRYKQREEFHWGIVHKANNKLIGRTGLIRIDPAHEKAELAYVLSNDYWSQGIVTEATYSIVAYCFLELGLNRIEARCNHDNPGSYKVMEKLGLTFEGLLRKQLKIKGEFVDQLMYAALREDWIRDRKNIESDVNDVL